MYTLYLDLIHRPPTPSNNLVVGINNSTSSGIHFMFLKHNYNFYNFKSSLSPVRADCVKMNVGAAKA